MTNPVAASKPRVIVVEDESDVRELMLMHLRREGLEADGFENGEEALAQLRTGKYHVGVFDWMLPGVSGLDLCKHVAGKIPVLMVTARADTTDIVRGLEAGADDYITKPFEIPIFLARVRALLRRAAKPAALAGSAAEAAEVYEIRGLRLDTAAHRVTCQGAEVDLTPSEFKLLAALMKNQGRVLSREKLIDLILGEGVVVVDRAIDTHVFGLRKKLGDCAEVIETIRGVGYRIETG